ncbi:MAG TPA: pyridoxamine 5'-phosphate oxidase family protein [Symbiobacteriaceae bacterium]|jgi:hypothetical protein
MSQNLGSQLSPELLTRLAAGEMFRPGGLGLPVLTIDGAGWPHVAMAPGCVAAQPGEVFVALGGQSRSLENVRRDGRLTLLIAGPDTLFYVKGRAELVRPEMQTMPQEAALRLTVTEVLQDMESFVTMTGGVSYRYNLMHEDFVTVIRALLDELTAMAEAE